MSDMIQIDLGDGYFTVIDAVDSHLADWGWAARICRTNTYAERLRANGGRQSLHRAIMGEPDGIVDHRDGDGLNNRRSNLRVVSPQINRRNIGGAPRNSQTGILGVSRTPSGRFAARIFYEGKAVNIGRFDTLDEARIARLATERELWGIQPRREAEMAWLAEMEAEFEAEP